ncbi:uncharacterized protein LOC114841439 [Diachasma alloeum]|uniref:uncharacterized protein LOC114841439 n=1 Tax=Diachasma alloeum TaxID=454923 RepID=UPI0010FB6384|nr:uncharacterized protein LOC114841439 [Diachasma alloeum]
MCSARQSCCFQYETPQISSKAGVVITSSRQSHRRSSTSTAATAFAIATSGSSNPPDKAVGYYDGNHRSGSCRDRSKRKETVSTAATMRVLNVLRHWVSKHSQDFEFNHQLKNLTIEFLDDIVGSPNLLPAEHKAASQLLRLISKEEPENSEIDLQKLLAPPSELLTEEAKSLTISNLQGKLEMLETYWEKFESTHEKLIAGSGKIEGILELPYFKDHRSISSDEELLRTAHQVTQLCLSGGFPLTKWHSNSPALLTSLQPDSTSQEQRFIEDSLTKILGVSWHPGTDNFKFSVTQPETSSITKRIILSETAQLFDPLGFLAPVVIRAKILLQALWIEKLGWDEPVSQTTAQRWSQFREELTQLSEITIPRWLGLLTDSVVEVHGFSDASQVAMSAVIYLKVLNKGKSQLTLVCSKTKVAPLKRLTIPRLELTAALLLAKLTKYVKDQLNLTNATTYLWTDSSVTLTWISSHSSRWKEFVKNRVALIQELTQQAHWRLVPGKENPADCASRGLSAHQLVSHKLWWKGPPWLHQDCSSWPTHALEKDLSADLEEKPGVLLHVKAHPIALWNLVDRFSSFNRLLRVTAICRRFIARLRKTPNSSLRYPLTLGDLEEARILWIKLTQAAHFKDQLRAISRGERFSKSHPLTKLTPFIDRQGVLRIGGRLKFAHIGPESRNQVIIPKESQLAQLLIGQAHLRTLHGGTQLTLRQLRSSYWILGGRAPVRSFILKCVNCTRQRGVRAQQLMGQLPPARLTPARAFLNTGIDYAGPVSLRSWKGRGHKSYKGWLAIFVCMTTSAVHLEVVSDYSAEGFIAAYRRFSSRRGIAHSLFSDCGTNFLGADKELKKLFSSGSAQSRQLAQLLINDGTQWSFNPPAPIQASHQTTNWYLISSGGKGHHGFINTTHHGQLTLWKKTSAQTSRKSQEFS